MNFLPLANAGTPLIWGGCLLLLGGNFVIGEIEARILRRLTQKEMPAGPLILANYASMIGGLVLLWYSPAQNLIDESPFRHGPTILGVTWLLAFLLTLVLESPFYAYATKARFSKPSGWLPPMLLTNAVTYGAMTLIVYFVGSVSMLNLRYTPPAQMELPPGWIYYLTHEGNLRKVRLDRSRDELVKIGPIQAEGHYRIVFEPSETPGNAKLFLYAGFPRIREPLLDHVRGTVATGRPSEEGGFQLNNLLFDPGSTLSFGKEAPIWAVDYWSRMGLYANGRRYALETPLASLLTRSATELPDGQFVLAVGRAIVVVDSKQNRATELAIGHSPAVILDINAPTNP